MNKLINDKTFTNIKGWRWKYDNFDYTFFFIENDQIENTARF